MNFLKEWRSKRVNFFNEARYKQKEFSQQTKTQNGRIFPTNEGTDKTNFHIEKRYAGDQFSLGVKL